MMLYLYLEVDLSDDDADLDEVARDCGHTLVHPKLADWDLVGVTNWHGELAQDIIATAKEHGVLVH